MSFLKKVESALVYSPNQNFNKLKFKVYRRNTEVHYSPCSLSIDLTTDCNLSCPWCSTERYRSESSSRQISLSGAKEILDKFNKATFVGFCGAGETFLHQDLFKMAMYANRLKMKVLITTNGTLLSERMEELLNSNIDTLEVSLKTTCDEEFQQITVSKKNSLSSIITDIRTLSGHSKRPRLSLSYVCNRDSVHNIPRILEIASQCRVDELCFYNKIPDSELRNESECLFEDDREWVLKILDSNLMKSSKIVVDGPHFYSRDSLNRQCKSPFGSLRIGVDGGVSGCGRAIHPSLTNGNAFYDADVFNSEHFRKLRSEHINSKIPLRYECLYCENRL